MDNLSSVIEQMQERLAAATGHDLIISGTTVRGWAELLEKGRQPDPKIDLPNPAQIICENCKHWDTSSTLATDDGSGEDTGMCRARAPGFDDRTGKAVWPFTETCDWCGDFKEAPKDDGTIP